MNRNKQLRSRSFFRPSRPVDDVVELPNLVGGRLIIDRVSIDAHYAQFTPKAFSLQAIKDNGLVDELVPIPQLRASSLDALDYFDHALRSGKMFEPVVPSSSSSSEPALAE